MWCGVCSSAVSGRVDVLCGRTSGASGPAQGRRLLLQGDLADGLKRAGEKLACRAIAACTKERAQVSPDPSHREVTPVD